VSKLARALDLSRQAIHKWPDEIPELYQYKLHHLTGGKLGLSEGLPKEGRPQ
jgi:hypothetical protein